VEAVIRSGCEMAFWKMFKCRRAKKGECDEEMAYERDRICLEVMHEMLERYREQQRVIDRYERMLEKRKVRASYKRETILRVFAECLAKQTNLYYYSL
jgi:hypothetical protein